MWLPADGESRSRLGVGETHGMRARPTSLLLGLVGVVLVTVSLRGCPDRPATEGPAPASDTLEKSSRSQGAPTDDVRGLAASRPGPAAARILAHVIAVDRERGLVVVDGGATSGIVVGDVLAARRPTGEDVELRVVDVRPTQAVTRAALPLSEVDGWLGCSVRPHVRGSAFVAPPERLGDAERDARRSRGR